MYSQKHAKAQCLNIQHPNIQYPGILYLSMSTLYLIPCPIAENALHTVPPYAQEIARNLDVFIVERAKTARHFIKSLGPTKAIQEMIFVELPDNQD